MSEKVEKLRAMIREEISAALAAGKTDEEKKTLKVKEGATEDEVLRALESVAEKEGGFKCPSKDCDHSAAEEFNPCPKCGAKVRWEDAT